MDDDTERKFGNSYKRLCSVCQKKRVHDRNTAGLCPDCYVAQLTNVSVMSWPDNIAALHDKFKINDTVRQMNGGMLREFLAFRLAFLKEELRESEMAETAAEFVDGMIDLCVVAVGTLDAFGVDIQEAWRRVHVANMAKEAGINPSRPNQFDLPDLVKPEGWLAPDHADNVGLLSKLFNTKPALVEGDV